MRTGLILLCTAAILLVVAGFDSVRGQKLATDRASPIGKVVSATGTITIEHTSAVVAQANVPSHTKPGELVYKGDVVSTGADGRVGVVFNDGTTFNMSSNARVILNEFVYDPRGSSNSGLISLMKGTFTFIAGKVATTGDMRIDTPVATMGIRGTAPRVEITSDGAVTFSTLVEEGKTKSKEGLKQLQKETAPADAAAQQENPFQIVLKDMGLCNGLDRTGGPDSQIKGCTALIESDEKTNQTLVHAYNNRGNAYAVKGDYDLAIKDYDDAIKADAKDSKAFYNRGLAYNRKGQVDRAVADLDEAIKLDPYYTNALVARAQLYQKKNQYDRAVQDYDAAIGIAATWGRPWNGRCWVKALLGQLDAALSDCNESLRLDPNNGQALDTRGLVYLKLGEFNKAIADYDAALKLEPKTAASLYGRGLARIKQGDRRGSADIEAAKAIQGDIAEEFARYGVT